MKRLTIQRGPSTDQGTFGAGSFADALEKVWRFLELPWRDNHPFISCVPTGVYVAKPYHSPHFGRIVYRFQDVPGRDNVEMHPANFAGDVGAGWYSNLEGCAAPGLSVGELMNPAGKMQQAVLHSGVALDEIFVHSNGEDIEIEFIDG